MSDNNNVINKAETSANRVQSKLALVDASERVAQTNTAIEKLQQYFADQNKSFQQLQVRIVEINAPLKELVERLAENDKIFIKKLDAIINPLNSFAANTAAIQASMSSIQQLTEINSSFFGKKSVFQQLTKDLGKNAKIIGTEPVAIVNRTRDVLAESFIEAKTELEAEILEQKLATEKLDLTLPPPSAPKGSVHPVSQVMDELAEIFADLGFSVATGPEIEDDWHNFTALNIPETHPARAMHDTFYFPDEDENGMPKLLRTHTSPVQIRTMMNVAKQTGGAGEPIYLIAPGRTYRSDSDATHTPMFHQVEGLVIDKNIHMGHLKWTLETFVRAFFERDDIELRLRPSYFPFTEPSAEVDVGFSVEGGRRIIGGDPRSETGGWMEILGSGMVHPNVIRNCGLDPDVWQGFAFGCGIDRLAMLKYGMDDLRAFFDGDLRWADHYGFGALDVPTLSGGVGA